MCGIFGIISNKPVAANELTLLARQAERRGKDSSGLYFSESGQYNLYRASIPVTTLLRRVSCNASHFVMGHSRLITNGLSDNQPVYRDAVCVIHNGIVVNHEAIWKKTNRTRHQEIDTEIIAAIAADALDDDVSVEQIAQKVLEACLGVVACALALPKLGKLCLFSNNGSLYVGEKDGSYYFSSELFPLSMLGCSTVEQVRQRGKIIDIPKTADEPVVHEIKNRTKNLIPAIGMHQGEEKLLEYRHNQLRRCTRCILPETMPFIRFDEEGVCNYCRNYKPKNKPRPVEEIFKLVEPYRRTFGDDCIVPFSGGRDSCYGLHLIVKELKMKPVTYTYDWGMVTDLGRRNISRMSAELGVENIIVAEDISLKRRNIALNLKAWLQSPNLGMVSILTAGDKHFFRHVEDIKKRTGISLNLWGINPLEVTHFKAGFLGVPPNFEGEKVYSHGAMEQMRYQWLRLRAMLESPGYFNRSLWDTLSGEYYRSFAAKTDYFHIFDFWRWDENQINDILFNQYDWEKSPDTSSTWRIGDGTAAIYNYIYYTVAGFSEHDTFRSNQIREGDITREQALKLVQEENRPRYPNIKWYLDAIGMEFELVIKIINSIPKLGKE
jgi:glucosamine--fructose-6-phosphate aminotransferase (isomerizing)